MSRDELIEAMEVARNRICIRAFPDGYRLYDGETRLEGPWRDDEINLARQACDAARNTAALSVLTPILKRVAEGLEPFAAVSAETRAGTGDDSTAGIGWSLSTYRTASALHQELKGLLS